MSSGSDDARGPIACLVFGGIFFVSGFRKLKLARKIQGLATSKIRSMAMGTVEISGIARMHTPLLDPIYQKPCTYFDIKAQEYRRSGKSGHWATVWNSNSDGKGFYCQDATGRVLVIPNQPELHISSRTIRNGLFNGANKNDPAFTFLNQKVRGMGSKRLIMQILREGDPIYVLGFAQPSSSKPVLDSHVSDSEAMNEFKSDPSLKDEMDSNHDGQIDSMEWAIGLTRIKEKIRQKRRQKRIEALDNSPIQTQNGVVTRSDDCELILASSEKDVLEKFGWAFLEIIGGGLALAIGVIWLLSIF